MGFTWRVVVNEGDTYNRLTFIRDVANRGSRKFGLFKCSCGKEVEKSIPRVVRGHVKSCGCYRAEQASIRRKLNGKHNLCNHNLYHRWNKMKSRCYRVDENNYHNYGGRGIRICDEWLDFTNFYNWSITNGYSKELQLDRIDNNKGYSPDNCRWITSKKNLNNTRRNIVVTFNNSNMSLMAACESVNLRSKYSSIRRDILSGINFDQSYKRFLCN